MVRGGSAKNDIPNKSEQTQTNPNKHKPSRTISNNPTKQTQTTLTMLPKYTSIGYTKKAYGHSGELKFHIEEEYMEDFLANGHLFLSVQNKPLPFFIEGVRSGTDLIVKLEEVDTPAQAKELTSSEVFLREMDISTKPVKVDTGEFTYEMLVGFLLIDAERGEIGPITEVKEHKFQDLLIVNYEARELMIPLHEDLIESVDPEAKKITLRLAEGLLEL